MRRPFAHFVDQLSFDQFEFLVGQQAAGRNCLALLPGPTLARPVHSDRNFGDGGRHGVLTYCITGPLTEPRFHRATEYPSSTENGRAAPESCSKRRPRPLLSMPYTWQHTCITWVGLF